MVNDELGVSGFSMSQGISGLCLIIVIIGSLFCAEHRLLLSILYF